MTAYDGEIWKQYDKTPYFVSNCGRVKRIYKMENKEYYHPG